MHLAKCKETIQKVYILAVSLEHSRNDKTIETVKKNQ